MKYRIFTETGELEPVERDKELLHSYKLCPLAYERIDEYPDSVIFKRKLTGEIIPLRW